MADKNIIDFKILKEFPKEHIQKKNCFQKIKRKKYIIFVIIIYLLLIIALIASSILLFSHKKKNSLHSKNPKQNRNLYNDYNGYNNYNDDPSQNNTEDDSSDVIAIIVVVLYLLFIFLSLYIGFELKSLCKSDEVFYNVLKFIYMSNNGYLFVSLIDNVMKASGISIATLGISIVICVIGTIIYLVKFCKAIFSNFFEIYFSFSMLKSWYSLPCTHVWNFMTLTDPCCYCDHYTVTTYSDGTTTSDRCCVETFNTFMFLVKRLSLILSIIVYFIFLLILTVVWGIIKVIYSLVKDCKCNCGNGRNFEVNNNANNQQNPMVHGYTGNSDVNNNSNNQNKIKSKASGANKRHKRNKSQIIRNNTNLQNSGVIGNLNSYTRRQSLNLNLNMGHLPNNSVAINQGNNIYIQDA